jgi:hypothetical protein
LQYLIKNDRLYQAAVALVTGEKDARDRVRIACEIVSNIHPNELSTKQLKELNEILDVAKRFPALFNPRGEVVENALLQTTKRGKNQKASQLAFRLFRLHEEVNLGKDY